VLARPRAFGIHAEEVDGQDVRAVHATAERLVERARSGGGPAFLVCHTYRFHGHHVGDVDRAYYRSREEEADWRTDRDPIGRLEGWLREQGVSDDQLHKVADEVKETIEAGLAEALAAPFPDPSEVDEHVYA